jgi:solute carrier family 25 (adenine nucleotide translocator) protein 4/5/6/31
MDTKLVLSLKTNQGSPIGDLSAFKYTPNRANDGIEPKKMHITETQSTLVHNSIIDVVAGAAAGALAKTAVAPIERVKLLMQLSRSVSTNSNTGSLYPSLRPSSTGWEVAKQVYQEQGLRAFWRGNFPNIIRQGGTSALNFLFMDRYKQIITPISNWMDGSSSNQKENHDSRKRQRLITSFLSGGLAGGSTTTLLYPLDFLRTRLAMDMGNKLESRMYPRGMRDVLISIWKTDGLRGYYQGYGIALSGVVLYRALHLGGYDVCKAEFSELKMKLWNHSESASSLSWGERIFIAELVSLFAGTVCYPIDSVRRRLMMQSGVPSHLRPYHNSIHAFRKIWMEEGLRGFFLGIGPNIFRSVSGALLLVSYDLFKEILSK